MHPAPPISAPFRTRAFSLVEVAAAIAIVAFAFVGILGLLPVGMSTFRNAIDTTVSAQIAQRVIDQAQQTDFNQLVDFKKTKSLPPGFAFRALKDESEIRYFDDQANELPATRAKAALYHVVMRVAPQTVLPHNLAGTGEANAQTATITVQVAQNPRGLALTFFPADPTTDPNRCLIEPAKGLSITTHSSVIARSQRIFEK